jgi:hypothetical protein
MSRCDPKHSDGSTLPFWVSDSTVGSVTLGGGSSCGNGGSDAPYKTYHWTAPAADWYTFTLTGADFTNILSLRNGCAGAELACNEYYASSISGSPVTVNLTAGQQVLIVVNGMWGESGSFTFTIESPGALVPTPTDTPTLTPTPARTPTPTPALTATPDLSCAQVDLGSALPIAADGDTSGSTDTRGVVSGCSDGSGAPDVTYRWTAPSAGTYTIATDPSPSFFWAIFWFAAADCQAYPLTCGFINWQETVTLNAGQTIIIVVDAQNGQSGTYHLSINAAATPTVTPTPVLDCGQIDLGSALPVAVSGTMVDATDVREAGTCGGSGAPDVAYRWTAPADGAYTFEIDGSDFDSTIDVRQSCSAASSRDCTDYSPSSSWNTHIRLPMTAGRTVTVVVDGYGSNDGTFSLESAPQGNYHLTISAVPTATPSPTQTPVPTATPTFPPVPTAAPLPTRPSSLGISVIPGSGPAPLDVTFRYDFRSVQSVQSIGVDFDGDGTDDFTTSDPQATLQHTYSTPGTYTPRLTVTGDQGTALSATGTIEVLDGVSMDVMFTTMWNGMNNALVAGDKDTALSYLTDAAKEKYGPVFDVLLPYMADISASLSALQRAGLSSELCEYAVNRTINGQDRVFFIYFRKGDDGVWRISAM